MLHCVLLQGPQVSEAFSAPHALELSIASVDALVFGQVLSLFEVLVAAGALIGFLACVHTPVSCQLRGVLEALFAVRTLQRLLAGRIAAVLHELGGGEESAVTQRTLQRLLSTVRVLVALQRRRFFVALAAHVTLVGLI